MSRNVSIVSAPTVDRLPNACKRPMTTVRARRIPARLSAIGGLWEFRRNAATIKLWLRGFRERPSVEIEQ
jgi:hypothetical protein